MQPELNLSQIEIATEICDSLGDVRTELSRLRLVVADAAAREDSRILATGTHPFTEWLGQQITPRERYQQLEPAFWEGIDAGYATYRTELFGRWPTTGTPHVLGSRAEYDRVVDDLVSVGAIPDGSFLYWDLRPSTRFSTLEFRAADVCLTVDEAVMMTALSRSIVRTCYRAAEAGEPSPQTRPEILQAARWRASRYGLDGELIDVDRCSTAPGPEVVRRLVDVLRPDLEEHDEWDLVSGLVDQTLGRGNGAQRQRTAFRDGGDLRAVADFIARETVPDAA